MLCFIVLTGKAQESAFYKWGLGINAGSYGAGIQGATALSPNFNLRVGFDYFDYNFKESGELTIEHNLDNYNGPRQDEFQNGEYSVSAEMRDTRITFPNFKALLDYYPIKNGAFSLTGGFYYGKNKVYTNAIINEYQKMVEYNGGEQPELSLYGMALTPNSDGSFDGRIETGRTFKPYIGLGFGRTIPRNRVGFKFEMGMVYQGKYAFSSSNISETNKDIVNDIIIYEELELPFSQELLNWWPILNFSLTYRIR